MKAHIGMDANSGLVPTVRGTSGNVADAIEANSLLHGQETAVFGDAGYQGVDKRLDVLQTVRWHVATRPGLRRALDKDKPLDDLIDQLNWSAPWLASEPGWNTHSGCSSSSLDLCEGPVPWSEEEHGADRHLICAVQPTDAQAQVAGHGAGARGRGERPENRGTGPPEGPWTALGHPAWARFILQMSVAHL